LVKLLDEAIVIQETLLTQHKVKVIRQFSSMASVPVHRVQLSHVFINLIKNAVEAMAKSELRELTLVLCLDEKGQPTVRLSDTGMGISAENMKHMLTHGFTTKTDGHGFGLAFCLKAVDEMGGYLALSSEGEGKGATFSITFPALSVAEG